MFATRLERQIRTVLGGDGKVPGLYQSVLSSATWDDFTRIRAQIVTYETVLRMMQEIAKEMNADEERPPPSAQERRVN